MRGSLIALLIALAALSGCAEDPSDEDLLKLADGTTLELGEGTSATLGAIAGVVVDEAIRPVEGANLATTGGLSATSDANGVFRLGNLEPGLYILNVQAPGFLPAQTSAEVVADATSTLKVQMLRDLSPTPYHLTYQYEAYMQAWGTIGQWAVEVIAPTPFCDCTYTFTPEPGPQTILFEAFWDPTVPDPAGLSEFYWEMVAGESDWIQSGYCTNPCRVEVPLESTDALDGTVVPFPEGATFEVRISGPDAWVAYQQQVTLFTTLFHNGPAPEGWTIASPA